MYCFKAPKIFFVKKGVDVVVDFWFLPVFPKEPHARDNLIDVIKLVITL